MPTPCGKFLIGKCPNTKEIIASLITRMMLLFVLLGLVPDAPVDAQKDITTLTRMSEVTSKRTIDTKEIQ